jgi:hypothetical protein
MKKTIFFFLLFSSISLFAQKGANLLSIGTYFQQQIGNDITQELLGDIAYERGISDKKAFRLQTALGYYRENHVDFDIVKTNLKRWSIPVKPELRFYPLGSKNRFFIGVGPSMVFVINRGDITLLKPVDGLPMITDLDSSFFRGGAFSNIGYQYIFKNNFVLQGHIGYDGLFENKELLNLFQAGISCGKKF